MGWRSQGHSIIKKKWETRSWENREKQICVKIQKLDLAAEVISKFAWHKRYIQVRINDEEAWLKMDVLISFLFSKNLELAWRQIEASCMFLGRETILSQYI